VGATLFRLTGQMFLGLVSLFAFNLVDLYFVGKLGTMELAALSYSFPVIILLANVALGIGAGASAVVSRAFGEKDKEKVTVLTTNTILFALGLGVVLMVLGNLTIEPLFTLLGAGPEMLPLIKKYMTIWYSGMIFFVVPMVGNNITRALGDVKITSAIMFSAVLVNLILDPLLIFGIGPFPRLGLEGAAIATVVSRMGASIVSLWVLAKREKLIKISKTVLKQFFSSLKKVLSLGLANAGSRMMVPIAIGVVTRLLSSYGTGAVAAFGIGTRIEAMAMTLIFSMASVIGPFIGQNCGAGQKERVKAAANYSDRFSLLWGAGVFFFFLIFAKPIAGLFNQDPEIISIASQYLKIATIGCGLQGVLVITASAFIVLHKPLVSFLVIFLEVFILYIPFSFLGNIFFATNGIFAGIALSFIISGLISRKILISLLEGTGYWKGKPDFCSVEK